MPNKDRIRLLVDALRSGQFQQGRNRLTKIINGEAFHCCLGVACQVAIQHGVSVDIQHVPIGNEGEPYSVFYDGQSGFMPPKVAEWYGFTGVWHGDEYCTPDNPRFPDGTATELNDTMNFSFAQIADEFEAEFLTKENEQSDGK